MNMDSIPTGNKEETMKSQEKLKYQLEKETQSYSQLRIMKNFIIICLANFLLYLPYQSLTNLQSTINFENNVGMISQAIIFVTNIFSCFFLPKLIIKKVGCKYTFVICILTSPTFYAANFYPHMWAFFTAAGFLGLGAGVHWSTIGYYINEISVLYAVRDVDADIVISNFFGIFYMFFQNSQIWGNLITFYILKPNDRTTFRGNLSAQNYILENQLYEISNVSCGAAFCGGMNENLIPPSEHKKYILMTAYLSFVIISALTVFLFLDPLKQKDEKDESVFSNVIATGKHLRNINQLLLIPLTMFCGIEEAFIVADFSKAYVACASGLYNVSLVYICFGVMNAIMSFVSGRLNRYVPRAFLLITAAVINLGVGVALLLWQPNADALVYFFIFVGVMGLCDAIWRTQLHAVYGIFFKEEQEAAFSNFRLWESVGFGLGFAYSSFLCIYHKIYILLAFIIVGITGFIVAEIRHSIFISSYNVPHSPQKE